MTELSIPQALDAAKQLHRDGNAKLALAIYAQILTREPDHAEALHLTGLLTSQMGRQEAAMKLIQRAIAVNPLAAEYRTTSASCWMRWDEPTMPSRHTAWPSSFNPI